MRTTVVVLSLGLCLGQVSTVGTAHAEPSAQEKAQATKLFDQALAAYKDQRYAEALPLFEASQQLNPSVGALLYSGECYRQVGKSASAWGAFREASRLAVKVGDKRDKVAAEKADEIEKGLSYLTIEVPSDRRVEGLEIRQDGKPLPSAMWGASVPIDPGAHRLEFTAPDHEPAVLEVTVKADGARQSTRAPQLKARASATQAAPTPPPSTEPRREPQGRTLLSLQVLPEVLREEAEIRVDGDAQPSSEWGKAIELPPGKHAVQVKVRCRKTLSQPVTLNKGYLHTFVVSLPPPERPAPDGCPAGEKRPGDAASGSTLRTVGYVTAGLGAAVGVGGGIVAWRAASDATNAQARGEPTEPYRTPYTTGLVMLGVGGSMAVTGIVLLIANPATPTTALHVGPAVGRGEGGLWLSGRW